MNEQDFLDWDDQNHDSLANMDLPDEYTFWCQEEHVDSMYKVLKNALELAQIDYQRQICRTTDAKFIAYNEFLYEMTKGFLMSLDDASIEARYRWLKMTGTQHLDD